MDVILLKVNCRVWAYLRQEQTRLNLLFDFINKNIISLAIFPASFDSALKRSSQIIVIQYFDSCGSEELTVENGRISGFQFQWVLIDTSGNLFCSPGVRTFTLYLTVRSSQPCSWVLGSPVLASDCYSIFIDGGCFFVFVFLGCLVNSTQGLEWLTL